MSKEHTHKYEVLHVSVPDLEGAEREWAEAANGGIQVVESNVDEPPRRQEETVEICRACGDVKRREPTEEERAAATQEVTR